MDIVWFLLTLPYAPVRGLTAVVKVIAREAESQMYNPVNIRRELEELDQAAEAGDISRQERDRKQAEVLDRLTPAPATGGDAGPGTRGEGARAGPGTSRRAGGPAVRRPAGQRRTGRGDTEQRRGR